jgi:ribosomal protein S21
MVVVKKQKGESEDKLINRFKKKVLDEGIVIEARERKEYKPKSQIRKEKKYRLKFLDELARKRAKNI